MHPRALSDGSVDILSASDTKIQLRLINCENLENPYLRFKQKLPAQRALLFELRAEARKILCCLDLSDSNAFLESRDKL